MRGKTECKDETYVEVQFLPRLIIKVASPGGNEIELVNTSQSDSDALSLASTTRSVTSAANLEFDTPLTPQSASPSTKHSKHLSLPLAAVQNPRVAVLPPGYIEELVVDELDSPAKGNDFAQVRFFLPQKELFGYDTEREVSKNRLSKGLEIISESSEEKSEMGEDKNVVDEVTATVGNDQTDCCFPLTKWFRH